MKWIAILIWMGLCPVVLSHLRQRPSHLPFAAFAMGILPFVMGSFHLNVAPIAWPGWAGWPKGTEITVLDFLAIAIIGATQKRTTRLRQLWPWFLYLAAVVIALPQANVKMAGFFYIWQLMRMILVAAAALRLAAYPGSPEMLFRGIFAGVAVQVFFAIGQVAEGAVQAGGAFGAQNLLGLMAHFALFPAFAMLLAGRRGIWPPLGFASAIIVDLLTASRATLGLAAIGLAILVLLSLYQSFSTRKMVVIGVGALLAAGAVPFALHSIQERQGSNSVESSDSQRNAMKQAAWMIIRDYPLGTGPDQYVVIANMGGYAARAGVAWQPGMRGTAVHNSYLLIWAETGLLGLITMILVLAAPVLGALRAARRFKRDPRSDMLVGVAAAGIVLIAHLLYEWAFVLATFQYTFAIASGVAVGLCATLAASGKAAVRRPAIAEARDLETRPLSPAE